MLVRTATLIRSFQGEHRCDSFFSVRAASKGGGRGGTAELVFFCAAGHKQNWQVDFRVGNEYAQQNINKNNCYNSSDPAVYTVVLDSTEYTIVLDPTEYTVVLDSTEYTVALDSTEYTVVLDSTEYTVVLDSTEYTVVLDPTEYTVALDPTE